MLCHADATCMVCEYGLAGAVMHRSCSLHLTKEVTMQDPKGKPYYWHTETQKTQWEKPTAETPIK